MRDGYYAFASFSPLPWIKGIFHNEAGTLEEAKRDREDLRKRGCKVGPIVKVPIPTAVPSPFQKRMREFGGRIAAGMRKQGKKKRGRK